MTHVVVYERGNVGLGINTRKTVIMKIWSADTSGGVIEGKILKEVDRFTCLGCKI